GITLGYHRLLTHKSLKVPDFLRYFFVSGGYLCFMGAPVNWVGVHRLHHQKSDMDGDPHSPRDGFKHSLYEWMFTMAEKQSTTELQKQVPDLMEDKVLCALGVDHSARQAGLCLSICVIFRLLTLVFFGWPAFLANLFASFMVFWSPQLVNSICHMKNHGYRLLDTRDESRNVWWVAMLSFGEGWHNNHHAIPKSARHGMAWWEFDFTYMVILMLEKVGLAWDVIRPPELVLAKAQSEPTTPMTQATVAKEVGSSVAK
ncbi:MAG: acyl-CoA desaturase, partial [Candidatus Obscuribacterales bacterium]|nr:acyl-CoA desaturase [Candidatus Obscuribacterales bacterium]